MQFILFVSVAVFLAGAAIYFYCQGWNKASWTKLALTMFWTGLLSFLMSSGVAMQSCGGSLTGAPHAAGK